MPGAEPEPPPAAPADPAPPTESDDNDNPLPVVIHLVKTTSGIDSTEVMRWLTENRVIPKPLDSFSKLPREALALLVEKWGTVTSDIRGD